MNTTCAKSMYCKLAALAAAMCAAVLPSFADATAPDLVTSEALFWLDASTLSAAAGTEIDSWADVRGGSHPGVTTYTDIKPQVIEIADGPLAGKKAVTFFEVGTVCDMKFAANQTVRTAFFVVDMDQSIDAFLLGGAGGSGNSYYALHRGSDGAYLYGYSAPACTYWNDGVKISTPTTTIMPTGYQLITWQLDANITPIVNRITQDRAVSGRVGGKRLCEVVAFNRVLSDYERSEVEAYLKAKWYGEMPQMSEMTSMIAKKLGGATVHFDASFASSFHYGVDGDETGMKVSQWDDLSGHNNHFITNITAATPNYGTVGTVAGQPVFDSGAASSGIDLQLGSPINARTVFLVAEVERSGNVFWLGDSSSYRFHRGGSGQYAYNNANVLIRDDKGGKIWCNGNSVTNALNTYPEMPGGLSVYVFSTSSNAQWGRLGLDRTSATRHGGKRVAELISFGSALSEENRALMEKLLMKKWRPSDAYVDSVIAGAAVHVDASSASNFNYTDGKITGWKNAGMDADLYRPATQYVGATAADAEAYEPAYGEYGFTNGIPAFLMGGRDSRIDLMFERLTNIRTVFWVMDINRNTDSFFLADAKVPSSSDTLTYHFHRGYTSGQVGCYAHTSYGAAFLNAITRCDRAAVSATTERPPLGAHVYDLVTKQDYTASSLSRDRYVPERSGDRAISELLIFTNSVAGLTRDAISERLENRWTKRCGWAGAGDAEWGVGKYRVFGADATVPAGGTSADGVGFTASATLSGGTLTLGDGGIFASEGTEVMISAPVTGKVSAYGPGKVTLTQALGTVDSLSVGYGTTLVLPPGGTVSNALSIQEEGHIVIDVSGVAPGALASIGIGGLVLPAGGTLEDYVSLSSTDGFSLTLSQDGSRIYVNDPNVPVRVAWNATASTDADVAANWAGWNFDGVATPSAVPDFHVTNVTLNADCDLGAWVDPVFGEGVFIDLNGHNLTVVFSEEAYGNAVFTNFNDGATAELNVVVADGATATNSAASILGNIKLVKSGLGTYVAAKQKQMYTGGTAVTEGTLKTGNGVKDSRVYPLGADNSVIEVTTNGVNRGVLNINGSYAQFNIGYSYLLRGGVLLNDGADVSTGYGQVSTMSIAADSTIAATNSFGMRGSATSDIDLGGHVLTVNIAEGKSFFLNGVYVTEGTFALDSAGTSGKLLFGGVNGRVFAATNTTLVVNSALDTSLVKAAGLSIDVGDYHALYAEDNNNGTLALNVHGTFKPAVHNYFYGCTMQDGSTIDLSSRTDALPLVSSFTTGENTLKFAAGTVHIKLGERSVAQDTQLISWSEKPSGISSTRFVNAEGEFCRRFSARADGLYPAGGMIIIVQ